MSPRTVSSQDRSHPGRRVRGSRRLAVVWAGALLGLVAAGCRRESSGFERYVPEPKAARAAVAAVLDAWRRGDSVDAPAGMRPAVYAVDKQRRPGQRLTRYEILGAVTAENARGVAVRLGLADPDEERVVRYLVVGTDPIWVFRQEDYEMISHWMHPMTAPDDRAAGPDPSP